MTPFVFRSATGQRILWQSGYRVGGHQGRPQRRQGCSRQAGQRSGRQIRVRLNVMLLFVSYLKYVSYVKLRKGVSVWRWDAYHQVVTISSFCFEELTRINNTFSFPLTHIFLIIYWNVSSDPFERHGSNLEQRNICNCSHIWVTNTTEASQDQYIAPIDTNTDLALSCDTFPPSSSFLFTHFYHFLTL